MDWKSVSVLGQKYKITLKEPEEAKEAREQGGLILGLFDGMASEIYINPKQDVVNKYRTLFHEMGHAVIHRSGLQGSGAVPMELEEMIVETMSNMQYEFLREFLKRMSKGGLQNDIKEIMKS